MRRRPKLEYLEQRRLLASDWQNAWRPLDVNADNFVSPIDALLGMNRLNSKVSWILPPRESGSNEPFYDTNGDGYHSPIDILWVINTLNGGLQVEAGLQADTGIGLGDDGITTNPTVQVSTSGSPEVVRARVGQGEWQDISRVLTGSGVFELTETVLAQLAGGELGDGRHRVDIEAGYSAPRNGIVDRAFVEFELDRVAPTADRVGSVLMTSPGTIEIQFNESLNAASIKPDQLSLYDVTWGEKAADPNWGLDGQHPRFPVQVQSLELSADSQRLIVRFSEVDRSAKYRLELRNIVKDQAGNSFNGHLAEGVWFVEANHFSSGVPPLVFGNTYRNLAQYDARILEYQFKLESARELLWSGDVEFGSVARYELYDDAGNLLRQLWPGTLQEPEDARRPAWLALPPGGYRLRVVEPPSSLSVFRVYDTSQLPELPDHRSPGNDELWPWDAYTVELAENERVFVESLKGQPILRAVFDPLGREVNLQLTGVNQYFDASLAGRHTVLVHRAGYQIYLTNPITFEVTDLNVPISGTLNTPGQVAEYSLPVTPQAIYLLRSQLDDGIQLDVNSTEGEVLQWGDPWLIEPDGGQFRLQLQRLSSSGGGDGYELRFEDLSAAPALPTGEWIHAPENDHTVWYRLPDVTDVGFEGEREFTFVTQSNGRFNTWTALGATVYRQHAEESGKTFVMIRGSHSSEPWRAMLPETVAGELDFATPNPLEFVTGLETFSFEFMGEYGEFVTADLGLPPESLLANLSSEALQLLDPTGRRIPRVEGARPANLWQLDGPGQYRLQLNNTFGTLVIGSGSIIASRVTDWQELQNSEKQIVLPRRSRYFVVPSTVRTLALDPDTSNGNLGATWAVFDQIGRTLIAASNAEIKLEWLDLPAGNQYYLAVINENPFESFEFRQLASTVENRVAQVDEPVNGLLQNRSDRLRVNIDLQRGQRLHWTGVPWGTEGDVHARLLGPSYEAVELREQFHGPFPAVWLVPNSGTYTIELRNASGSSQEIDFLVSLAGTPELGSGISGFGVVHEDIFARTESNQGVVSFPFEVEAGTAVLFDWLEDGYGPDSTVFVPEIWTQAGSPYRALIAFESELLVFEEAGQYELRLILHHARETGKYKFTLRDLSAAAMIIPGQAVENATIEPFASLLYQLVVPDAVDMELRHGDSTTTRVVLQTLFPGMKSTTSTATGKYSFASGTHAVIASSIADVTSMFEFEIQTFEHRQPLLIDRDNRVMLSAGRNRFQWNASLPLMRIVASLPLEEASVQVFDQDGMEVLPDELGQYELPRAETYGLEATLPNDSPHRWTTLTLANIPLE